MDISLMIFLLSLAVIASHISIIILLSYVAAKKFSSKKIHAFEYITLIIKENAVALAFTVVLTSTIGSLFFSEVANFVPCRLCWYQRAVMFPQVIILGSALYYKRKELLYSSLALSIIGAAISSYQYTGIIFSKVSTGTACSLSGQSCFIDYFREFGYIDISMMALTGFLMLIILAIVAISDMKK